MTNDPKKPAHERGEIVQSTLPEANPEVIDIPNSDPKNQTPTDTSAKLQREMTRGIIPDNEDG